MGDYSSAEETFTLPTVTVTGTYNTRTFFGWTTNSTVRAATYPAYLGNLTSAQSAYIRLALNCAKAYATTGPGANKGSRPGAATYVSSNAYGYFRVINGNPEVRAQLTNTPPSGNNWLSIAGITINKSWSYVWIKNHMTLESLIETFAHEWAHQWGASDLNDGSYYDATAIGRAARDAYINDNGKKCGGS